MTTYEIHQGSILDVDADCIVNPANSFLRHGGGLARVIRNAAVGPTHPKYSGDVSDPMVPDEVGTEWLVAEAHIGLVPTGDARITLPGHLADYGFKALIHAVGPIWGGGYYYERLLLHSAYREALFQAETNAYSSIAFPAISAGIFGVPIAVVAQEALRATAITGLDRVVFALMDDAHVDAFNQCFKAAHGSLVVS